MKRLRKKSGDPALRDENGLALLTALIALALVTLIGLSLAINSATDMKVGDNFASMVQARQASLAGLSHARELVRGLDFTDVLAGPDGAYDPSPSYLAHARTLQFRNPLDWSFAAAVDIAAPAAQLAGIPDDGIVNTGKCAAGNGAALIPLDGVAQWQAVGGVAGAVVVSRYFVKVSDNNREASEIGGDPADNPFLDGDGVVVVRSFGLARTIRETVGSGEALNSLSLFEMRLKRRRVFDLGAPVVVQGREVHASGSSMFVGESFLIDGGASNPGIATIDLDESDGIAPAEQIVSQIGAGQGASVQGGGATPSIADITSGIRHHADGRMLMDSAYLVDFVQRSARRFADQVLASNQAWASNSAPALGSFDPALPYNAAVQEPKVTLVDGDLSVFGDVSGAGILIVSGRLVVTGSLTFNGLILVMGAGDLFIEAAGGSIRGAVFVAQLPAPGSGTASGLPRITLGGRACLTFNQALVTMALRLLPVVQVGFREVTRSMDP